MGGLEEPTGGLEEPTVGLEEPMGGLSCCGVHCRFQYRGCDIQLSN